MFLRTPCLMLLAAAFVSGPAAGQDTSSPTKDQRARWMKLYSQEASEYQMFRDGDSAEELKLVPLPILTYTNPIRIRDTHGAAFVWTSDGRPEVVGAIWSVISPQDSSQRRLSHEFHSLSLVPIHSEHEPRTSHHGVVPDWSTDQPGIEPQRIMQSRPPMQTSNRRLSQMRQIARQFEVSIPPGLSDGQGSFRLLAQPIYRFSSERHHVLDGAVFAYVMGTDPELILLIEAVAAGDGHEWRFAAAPLTNLPMRLDYQGSRVWECERTQPYIADRPHFMYWGVSARDAVIE